MKGILHDILTVSWADMVACPCLCCSLQPQTLGQVSGPMSISDTPLFTAGIYLSCLLQAMGQ